MIKAASEHIDSSKKELKLVLSEVKTTLESLQDINLNTQEADGKWSILQCLKHMSIAVEVYNHNIGKALETGNHQSPDSDFKSHWKGDMFVKMISPKENGVVKNNMKTMKTMNPENSLDAQKTVDEFFNSHNEFIDLMEKSRAFNINRVKVNTAIGPLVKLRLGDAYRFIIAHAQRHLIQLRRIRSVVTQ